jgi:hypothetical protein
MKILCPMLYPEDPERLLYLEKGLIKVVVVEYGFNLDTIFTHDKYVDPLPRPTLTAASKASAKENEKEFEFALHEYVKACSERDKKKILLFGFIQNRMSPGSMSLLAATEKWDEVVLEKCPLTLWRRVKETHRAGVLGNDDSRKSVVIMKWHELKQNDREQIHEFKHNFLTMIDTMKQMRLTVPSDEELAGIFLRKLGDRYREFLLEIDHLVAQGAVKFPKTVEEAYTMAVRSKYYQDEASELVRNPIKQPKKSVRTSGEAFFKITANESRGKGKKTGGKKDLSEVRCHRCKKFGHYARDCKEELEDDDESEKEEVSRSVRFDVKSSELVPPKSSIEFEDDTVGDDDMVW